MKIELLAPAGSYESMTAAYAAGADAVYIGGTRFGARAYADNLCEEDLKRAIDYAHLKGRKLYLTVNTLLKESEMEELYAYLSPFYREGLDAVIVQDLGVFRFVKQQFPQMDIHASTQMAITGAYGAGQLKALGASRVVTARELSLKEIQNIHSKVKIELECFVHGALCYCYSGQCLYSSMIGGRSGNRGRCAQPCRLPYDLLEEKAASGMRQLNSREKKYLLSPKDMCTLEILPELVESGIHSFKIEGRMKRPEYTAGVVKIYRKYLDVCLEKGREGYRISRDDMTELMDLYNRGGFSKGYYLQQNGPDMMASLRPNHWGTKAAKLLNYGKKEIRMKALEPLRHQDILEYRSGQRTLEFNLDQDVNAGREFTLKLPREARGVLTEKEAGAVLYRTRNQMLLEKTAEQFLETKKTEKINGKLILSHGKSAILEIDFRTFHVLVTGETPQLAEKRPLGKADAEKQIRKTGGTEFEFNRLDVEMEENLFLPMQALNELRRKGIAELEKAIRTSTARPLPDKPFSKTDYMEKSFDPLPYLSVSLESPHGLDAVLSFPEVRKIYLDSAVFPSKQEFEHYTGNYVRRCHAEGKECFYVMPWIFRRQAISYYDSQEAIDALEEYDGILIKNMEEYAFLREKGIKKPLAADYNLYTFNREARVFWKEQGISYDTVPLELNVQEICERGVKNSELLVYGYLPLMVSAQCQLKNACGCQKRSRRLYLRDRKQKLFAVRNQCAFCYNVLYNSTPLELLENSTEVLKLNPSGIRLQFTAEDPGTVKKITESYIQVFARGESPCRIPEDFTRGHFKRGVE